MAGWVKYCTCAVGLENFSSRDGVVYVWPDGCQDLIPSQGEIFPCIEHTGSSLLAWASLDLTVVMAVGRGQRTPLLPCLGRAKGNVPMTMCCWLRRQGKAGGFRVRLMCAHGISFYPALLIRDSLESNPSQEHALC